MIRKSLNSEVDSSIRYLRKILETEHREDMGDKALELLISKDSYNSEEKAILINAYNEISDKSISV